MRHTLGDKIDSILIQTLEYIFVASYQSRATKTPTLSIAIRKIDLLKFFLRIAWESQAVDHKKYAVLSEKADELGRMVGGWKKGLESPSR